MHLNSFRVKNLIVGLACCGLTGCMVGPDFHPIATPTHASSYTAKPMPTKTVHTRVEGGSGKSQEFIATQKIPSQWWKLFHSKEINELVDRGIAHSPNMAAAYAALRQAQETLNAQIGSTLFPAFNANLGAQRQLFNIASIGGGQQGVLFNLFNTNVSVAYNLDVFGSARRQIEALNAQVDYQQFELIAVYLTLTSNIVTTAVTASAYQAQIVETRDLIANQEDQLKITRKQLEFGGVAEQSVLAQVATLEQTKASLPGLEQGLAQSLHALDVLVGDLPNKPLKVISLNSINLPTKLPVSMPSSLVKQRPDVRAAEALVHAASANIGVATANLLPQFTLSGAYGWQAGTPATLFATSTNVWNIASQITQPIFHGGALLAQRRGAIDAYQQSIAQYKQTVLTAFQNVADTLRALDNDAKRLKANNLASKAAYRNYKILQEQYQLGGISYTNVLVAQQQYQQSMLARIQSQASRFNDTVALFQALGGGWWNQPWCVKECLYEAT